MPKHTCTIHTACDSHAILHRLEDIAVDLPVDYEAVDLPFHNASPRQGELFVTRILPDGKRISGKITQTGDRTLEAEVVAAAFDTADGIRQLLGPLVDSYLTTHSDASEHISQEYAKA